MLWLGAGSAAADPPTIGPGAGALIVPGAASPPAQGGAAPGVAGPVIDRYGAVHPAPQGALNLREGEPYRVLMDVAGSGGFVLAINPALERAARFLNLHAQNGIDPAHLDLTLVVHGEATKDLLSDAAYRARYGVHNPNTRILADLESAGVDILVCSQSAAHRAYAVEEFHPAASMAVSAMTAHVRLQAEGYRLIPF